MVQSTELFLEYLAAEAEKEAKSHGKKTIGYDEMYVLSCFMIFLLAEPRL